MYINCTDDIIEKEDVPVRIQSPSKTYSGFLSPRKISSFLAYLCLLSIYQQSKVSCHWGILDDLVKLLFIVRQGKGDVILQRGWHNPGFLRHVSNRPTHLNHCVFGGFHLVQYWEKKWRLPTSYISYNHCEGPWLYLDVNVLQSLDKLWSLWILVRGLLYLVNTQQRLTENWELGLVVLGYLVS